MIANGMRLTLLLVSPAAALDSSCLEGERVSWRCGWGCRDGLHLERQYVLNVKAQVALVCGRFHGQGDLDAFVAEALS